MTPPAPETAPTATPPLTAQEKRFRRRMLADLKGAAEALERAMARLNDPDSETGMALGEMVGGLENIIPGYE